jgi:hypothetical protein
MYIGRTADAGDLRCMRAAVLHHVFLAQFIAMHVNSAQPPLTPSVLSSFATRRTSVAAGFRAGDD